MHCVVAQLAGPLHGLSPGRLGGHPVYREGLTTQGWVELQVLHGQLICLTGGRRVWCWRVQETWNPHDQRAQQTNEANAKPSGDVLGKVPITFYHRAHIMNPVIYSRKYHLLFSITINIFFNVLVGRTKHRSHLHGGFQKQGYPQIIHLYRFSINYKPSILGYPILWKPLHVIPWVSCKYSLKSADAPLVDVSTHPTWRNGGSSSKDGTCKICLYICLKHLDHGLDIYIYVYMYINNIYIYIYICIYIYVY